LGRVKQGRVIEDEDSDSEEGTDGSESEEGENSEEEASEQEDSEERVSTVSKKIHQFVQFSDPRGRAYKT